MGDQERNQVVEAIVADSAAVLQSYTDSSGVSFDLSANLAIAKG
jgi:hypothetical protein